MNRIRKLREEIGMTQVRLSIELEVAQETISAYEKDKHFPSVQNLIKMSEIFNASTDYILGVSDIRFPIETEKNETVQLLVSQYKKLPDHKKEILLAYLSGLSEQ